MAGRNDVVIVVALQAMAQAVQYQPNDGSRVLEMFQRNHSHVFKGRFDPDGAQVWLKEIERIF